MLERLHVRNYVLIDSLDIDFPEGLIIITGQTGAGKSILIGALSVVSGAKTDASVIGGASDNCVIEAEFDMGDGDDTLRSVLEENDVDWNGGHIIVRRVINPSGRSRSFINDSPVPLSLLSSISVRLIDIHSQHQTLLLADKRFQLSILDHFAGNAGLLARCAGAWSRYNALRSELAGLDSRIARIAGERDYNEAQFRQLEEARLRDGELQELEEEQKQLANAGEIKESLCSAESVFGEDEGGRRSVIHALKEAGKALDRAARFVPSVESLSDRLETCRVELDDIYSEISGINSGIDVSPDRLQTVDDRISLIYSLMQRHSCSDEASLIALRDELSAMLFDSSALEERRNDLEKEVSAASCELESAAGELHASRTASAKNFAEAIQDSIRMLELPYAIFEVDILPDIMSASGADTVMFRFSSSGKNAADVSRCASGGEMSRIMLALKAMMARFSNMPTMIFDEIDTGVSGSVADKMGSMICDMGKYMQVFAITHLPQVAAKGNVHYLVSKEIDPVSSIAGTKIEKLSDGQRVLEVARMLSGSSLTDAAVANAKSLLGQ